MVLGGLGGLGAGIKWDLGFHRGVGVSPWAHCTRPTNGHNSSWLHGAWKEQRKAENCRSHSMLFAFLPANVHREKNRNTNVIGQHLRISSHVIGKLNLINLICNNIFF